MKKFLRAIGVTILILAAAVVLSFLLVLIFVFIPVPAFVAVVVLVAVAYFYYVIKDRTGGILMFYCDKCAKKNEWPTSMFQSYGPMRNVRGG